MGTSWPVGEGEMAERIRRFDWSATGLGPARAWPASLRHAVDLILPSRQPMLVLWGPDLIQIYNDALMGLIGPEHHPCLGAPAAEVWTEIWPLIADEIALVRETGASLQHMDVRLPITCDGRVQDLWWTYSYSPVPDPRAPAGVGGVLVVATETTEQVRARNALAESEARQQLLLETLPHFVWRARDAGDWIWASPQWTAFTGLSAQASQGSGWLEAVHPEDRERLGTALRGAPEAGALAVQHRLREAATGAYRWFQTRAQAMPDTQGASREWIGASTDIDDLRRLQEHQKLLMGELQHRVRNMLSTVRSIARRTAETAEDVTDFASHFDGRLNAFGRSQAHLTRDPMGGVDLEYLVADELTACATRESARVKIGGPKVGLRYKAAETLTLAIHELATNSLKYGALAGSGGVTVDWSVDRSTDPAMLVLMWRETGIAAPLARPVRDGFGTELLLRTLPYELDATVTLEIAADSVTCMIRAPFGKRLLA